MKLVADTGALISLACSHYFDTIIKDHSFIIPPSVIGELKQFSRYNDVLGKKAREVLSKKLTLKQPHKLVGLHIENTERDVFSLATEEKCLVLTDDIHAARVAHEKLNLTSKPSFYLLLQLYKHKKIKKTDLINDFTRILANRNWLHGTLWTYAKELLEKL